MYRHAKPASVEWMALRGVMRGAVASAEWTERIKHYDTLKVLDWKKQSIGWY